MDRDLDGRSMSWAQEQVEIVSTQGRRLRSADLIDTLIIEATNQLSRPDGVPAQLSPDRGGAALQPEADLLDADALAM